MIAPVNRLLTSSLVDGDGNRAAVFFQGCQFRCRYCHNPETMALCSNCGACVEVCPASALSTKDGRVRWDRARCVECDSCIHACPHDASPRVRWMTPEQVLREIEGCVPFVRGVTCSGGECTLYADFMTELFLGVKKLGLSCLIDSNGFVDLSRPEYSRLMALCDGVMLDIKAADPAIHRALTGQDNATVLRNAVWLAEQGKLPEIRTVVTATLLDNAGTVDTITKMLSPYLSRGPIRYRITGFRPFGVRPAYRDMGAPPREELERLAGMARDNGFTDVVVV